MYFEVVREGFQFPAPNLTRTLRSYQCLGNVACEGSRFFFSCTKDIVIDYRDLAERQCTIVKCSYLILTVYPSVLYFGSFYVVGGGFQFLEVFSLFDVVIDRLPRSRELQKTVLVQASATGANAGVDSNFMCRL